MDVNADARRAAGQEILALAEEFEASDHAAFRRARIVAWVISTVVTVVVIGLLVIGTDWRYLLGFWVAVIGCLWAGYLLSTRRQRLQTARLRELAERFLATGPLGADPAAPLGARVLH